MRWDGFEDVATRALPPSSRDPVSAMGVVRKMVYEGSADWDSIVGKNPESSLVGFRRLHVVL
jgi:hypothetical protein